MAHHASAITNAMKRFLCFLFLCAFCAAFTGIACAAGSTPEAMAPTPIWITAYYAGWNQDHLKPADIDFSALTHLVHFSVLPRADGTLDTKQHDISAARSQAIIRATHAAKRKILLCVGGAESAAEMRPAIAPETRPGLIKNLLQLVTTRGYNGLDIDMEPLENTDAENYSAFIRELRSALRKTNPDLLLTCAVGHQQNWFSLLQDEFDQVNIMTYDQSGAWPGWETWHNASLFNSGKKFKTTDRLLPSAQLQIQQWLDAGFKPKKLGLGIAFYGTLWQGATGPNQSIEGVTVKQIGYRQMMRDYFRPDRYRWDEAAQAPYLSIDETGTANDFFISYDDEKLAQMKINFARENGLGGVIIWELGSAFRAAAPEGQRDNLLQAIKSAALFNDFLDAIYREDAKAVEKLLDQGVGVNTKNINNDTPLIYAINYSSIQVIRILIKHGASINAQDEDETTALIYAVHRNDPKIVELLLKSGAEVNIQNVYENTALDFVEPGFGAKNAAAILKLLKAAGAKSFIWSEK
jgi:chitinase